MSHVPLYASFSAPLTLKFRPGTGARLGITVPRLPWGDVPHTLPLFFPDSNRIIVHSQFKIQPTLPGTLMDLWTMVDAENRKVCAETGVHCHFPVSLSGDLQVADSFETELFESGGLRFVVTELNVHTTFGGLFAPATGFRMHSPAQVFALERHRCILNWLRDRDLL